MAVPAAIFVVCLAGGVYASARWLPELAAGPVGGLAFFVVCGLLGASLAVFGLGIYDTVEAVSSGGFGPVDKRRILADGLESLLWQTGLLAAAAVAVYLLAPPSDAEPTGTPVAGPESGPGPA